MVDATLGDRELDVMTILWEIGSGTVSEVRDRLGDPLAYTTVLTVLRNLESKRFVRREEEGRAHRYFPRVAQETAQKNALTRVLSRLFDGSPHALISQLVEQKSVSASELQQIARQLNQNSKSASEKDSQGSASTTGTAGRKAVARARKESRK